MEEITEYVERYLAHDAEQNLEGLLVDFDKEELQKAEDNGIIFIAVYSSGMRKRVKASEIVEPEPIVNGTKLTKPEYVDERMRAVCDVFDALAETMPSAKSRVLSDDQAAFAEALAALKAIVYGEEK